LPNRMCSGRNKALGGEESMTMLDDVIKAAEDSGLMQKEGGGEDPRTEETHSIPLADCQDLPLLQGAVETLYQLLDDIDTVDDAAKSNDVFYRKAVHRLQARKHESGIYSEDGFELRISLPKG